MPRTLLYTYLIPLSVAAEFNDYLGWATYAAGLAKDSPGVPIPPKEQDPAWDALHQLLRNSQGVMLLRDTGPDGLHIGPKDSWFVGQQLEPYPGWVYVKGLGWFHPYNRARYQAADNCARVLGIELITGI